MYDVNLGRELAETRKEILRLRQKLRWTQEELEKWQHCAILLTPEEIFSFYCRYREHKKTEREKNNQKTLEELDKLMISVIDMKKQKGNKKNEDEE